MSWYTLIAYQFIQAITPGPNDLTCLYLGGRYGLKGTLKFIVGSISLIFVKSLLCGALNAALVAFVPSLVVYVKWFGAAYMLYLAWNMIKSGWSSEEDISSTGYDNTCLSGIALQLLNAKSWIASLSMFALYVIPYGFSIKIVTLVSFTYLLAVLISSVVWSLFGSSMQKVIVNHKKLFGIVMGLSLLYCAVSAVV